MAFVLVSVHIIFLRVHNKLMGIQSVFQWTFIRIAKTVYQQHTSEAIELNSFRKGKLLYYTLHTVQYMHLLALFVVFASPGCQLDQRDPDNLVSRIPRTRLVCYSLYRYYWHSEQHNLLCKHFLRIRIWIAAKTRQFGMTWFVTWVTKKQDNFWRQFKFWCEENVYIVNYAALSDKNTCTSYTPTHLFLATSFLPHFGMQSGSSTNIPRGRSRIWFSGGHRRKISFKKEHYSNCLEKSSAERLIITLTSHKVNIATTILWML